MRTTGRRSGRMPRAGAAAMIGLGIAVAGPGAQAVGQQAASQPAGGMSPPGSARQHSVAPDCATCWVQEVRARPAASAANAPPANPTCYGQPSLDFFRAALPIVAPRTPPAAAGDLAQAVRNLEPPMFEALREGSAADFRDLLRLPAGEVPFANCMPLAVLLPRGARVVAVEASMRQGDGVARRCDPVTGACGDGGRFVQPPLGFAVDDRPAIGAVFVAAGAGEVAQIAVAYEAASGETPVPLR